MIRLAHGVYMENRRYKSLICLLILLLSFPLIRVIPICIQRSEARKEGIKVPQLKNNTTDSIKIKKIDKFFQREPYSEISTKSVIQEDSNVSFPIKADIQSGASNWGASTFKYRKNITIDCSKVPTDLTNFPVLVVLYDNDLRYHTQADGDDICFIDEFNRTLDYELEHFDVTYNETHAFMVMWIRIPVLSSSVNTTISMYYGNSTIGNQENATGVWGNGNYVGVWHMDETLQESSSRGNDGTNQGSANEIGKMGRARRFDGIDDYISLGVWDPGIGSGSYSISAWVRLDNTFNSTSGESMPIFGHYDSDFYNMVFTFAGQDNIHGNNGILYSKVEGAAGDGYDYIDSSTTSWQGETWIYVAGVANQSSGIGRMYVNGNSEGSMSNSGTPSFGTTGNYQIGRVQIEQTSGDEKFRGVIDEVRLFNGVYSSEWLLTEYRNQNDPNSFYTVNPEEIRDDTLPNGETFEVIIDTDVYDAIDEYNPGPNVVFINDSHGYVFFQKTNGGLGEIVYYKTINNGTSWTGPVNIDCGSPTSTYLFRSFSCWFDQWTPNNLGTKIHFIVNSVNYDEMMYNYLDTKDDSTSGTWLKLMNSGGSHNAPDGGGAVTVSTDGKIFGTSWMTNGPQFAKYDSSWVDITPTYSFLNDDDDHGQLLPLSGGDILCIYEDATNNILYSFIYDEENDIWDTSPTFVTTIISETEAPEDAYNNNANWGAVLNPNTQNIFLVLNNNILSSEGDLETWEFFDSNRTWLQKTNVAINVGDQGDEVKPAYDPNSDTLFVVSINGQNVYISNSTNGGVTWGTTEKINVASENWIVLRTNFISPERIYAIYFDDINNDVYGNTVVDLPKPLGKATIEVSVIDLDNREVPNAKVTLMNAANSSIFTSHNTTLDGYASFADVIFDYYNITVEFEDTINTTFSFQPIFSNTSYHLKPEFYYIVYISEYVDNVIPSIQNIYYENRSIQFANDPVFFADVLDESTLRVVNLSLTVINVTSEEPVIQGNFTMKKLSGDQYYNATALDTLEDFNARVYYKIIAMDIAYNIIATEIKFFYLGDIFAPNIVAYNVTDFKNGTLLFYANITDNMSEVMDPVILQLNDEFFIMHQNSSGYWTAKIQVSYGTLVQYSIYSANDSIGNENGSKVFTLNPAYGIVVPDDNVSPNILLNSIESHYKGKVQFFVEIDDHIHFQSGVNTSTVYLYINHSEMLYSYPMIDGGEFFYLELEFNYNDSFNYWINASDLAGNNNSTESLNNYFTIDDNYIPDVISWSVDYGNGTVDFFADIYDWPHNESSAFLIFTQNYFEPWINLTMIHTTGNIHVTRIESLDYNLRSIWFYVTAVDNSKNWFIPGLSDAFNFTLTDTVSPVITFEIVNSSINDGEITILAYATDQYGASNFINNTFYINMSLSSNFIFSEMTYFEFYRYSITSKFSFGEQVTLTIWVEDDSGNLGVVSKIITITDFVPPKIVANGVIDHQNGSVSVWAQVEESPYGSGLPENDSVVYLNYIHMYSHTIPMIWNGTGNFYSISIFGFQPGQGFTYNITVTDNMGNINSIPWIPVIIEDKVKPECLDFGMNQIYLNHTSTQIFFWVKAEDPFGNIKNVNISIYCYNGSNCTVKMDFNGSCYSIVWCLLCDQLFDFSIKIYDEALNVAQVLSKNLRTFNFQPTEVIDHGVEFIKSEEYIGKACFWIQVSNPYNDHNIRLSILDDSLTQTLVDRMLMESNGTHYAYNLAIAYLNNFSYIMEVIDPGVSAGYYYIDQLTNNYQMQDYWSPVIHETGINEINTSSILLWANVSDWGSGISEVYLNYEFTSQAESGGYGSVLQKTVLMSFNESLYIVELTFSESGTLSWYIEAYDFDNQSIASEMKGGEYSLIFPPQSIFDLVLEIIIIVIIGMVIAISFLSIISTTYQKRKKQKFQELGEAQEKLDSIMNIYMILVTTAVGIPIYSINNVIYRSTSAVRDIISGISVGIDTFLESFHSDFLNFFSEPRSDSIESETIDNVRTSVIEKNKVQIQIISSPTYRIFIFMKERPPEYFKPTFTKIIKILEEKIKLDELGVIEEALLNPIVDKIVRQHFPISLLSSFHINYQQIKRLEENQDFSEFLSRSTLNMYKRLVVIKSNLNVRINDTQTQINLFEKTLAQNQLQEVIPMTFSEALNFFTKILKVDATKIYKALWIGSTPEVDIIVPIKQEE